jgi:hypothetical protein
VPADGAISAVGLHIGMTKYASMAHSGSDYC